MGPPSPTLAHQSRLTPFSDLFVPYQSYNINRQLVVMSCPQSHATLLMQRQMYSLAQPDESLSLPTAISIAIKF